MSRFSEMKPAEENPQNIPEKIIQNEPIVTSIEDLLNIQKCCKWNSSSFTNTNFNW